MTTTHQDIIARLVEISSAPEKAIRAAVQNTGKNAFGYFPPRVPEELIYAAGYLPVGMWGGRTEFVEADRYLQGFCCSVLRANMELGLRGSFHMLHGVLIPTLCDSLKCVAENWKAALPEIPAIPVVYPQNRASQEGIEYMVAELKRVCRELGNLCGRQITQYDVESAFYIYEAYRAAMREFVQQASRFPVTIGAKTRHLIIRAAQFMDKKDYTSLIVQLTEILKTLPDEPFFGLRVIPTGLMGEPMELLDLFEENQIAFVADDLSQESRLFRTPARKYGDAWEKMAYLIADVEGDTFLYDQYKKKGDLLIKMIHESKADAVVVLMMKFCDPEEFDYPILKEQLEAEHIPMLYLETDQQMESVEQLRTRIQSFSEMFL